MKLVKKLVDWFEASLWAQAIKDVFENPEYFMFMEEKEEEK